jgi:hypothetical protein
MAASLRLLNYAGPRPAAQRTLVGRCWRGITWLITLTVLIAFVTVRGALLTAGFACVFAGLVLLTLGGKRSAARRLLEWRERVVDHVRLWTGDITRTLRRRRPGNDPDSRVPIPVVTVTPQ